MTTGQLAATLQGRHAQTREHVRRPVIIGQAVTAGGRPQPGRAYETVEDRAVAHAAFTLSAPEWATEAWRRSGPQQRAMIERALRTDDRLPARNRLDAWMNGHTGQAAQLVAVDRHLSERLHSRIAGEVDRAVLDPPDFVCTAIGSAPAPSAPERDEWVALTSTLVHDHHVAAASRAAGYEPPRRDPREQRELAGRVRNLRAQRELEGAGQENREGPPATEIGDTEVAEARRSTAASFPSAPGTPSASPATAVPRPPNRVKPLIAAVSR